MTISPHGAFGEWLYSRIGGDDANIAKLSRDLEIHRTSIYNHITGKNMPNRTTLKLYAKYFHEDYWFLYELAMG